MRRRSPGHWLAPLALVIAAVAVYAVVHNGTSGAGSGAASHTTTSAPARPRKRTPPRSVARRPSSPTSYSVQSGDTLSLIATKTGVSLERLRALNPGINESAMHIGQRIRLRP
jgi:LysM repeat protein